MREVIKALLMHGPRLPAASTNLTHDIAAEHHNHLTRPLLGLPGLKLKLSPGALRVFPRGAPPRRIGAAGGRNREQDPP